MCLDSPVSGFCIHPIMLTFMKGPMPYSSENNMRDYQAPVFCLHLKLCAFSIYLQVFSTDVLFVMMI